MSGVLMFICRAAGMIFSGWAMLMLAEMARYGAVTTGCEAWSTAKTLTAFTALITIGFLLSFGGVKQ